MTAPHKDKAISIRVDCEVLAALDVRATTEKKHRTEVIREALAEHLNLESFDSKLEALQKEQASSQQTIQEIKKQIEHQKRHTELIEARFEELRKIAILGANR